MEGLIKEGSEMLAEDLTPEELDAGLSRINLEAATSEEAVKSKNGRRNTKAARA